MRIRPPAFPRRGSPCSPIFSPQQAVDPTPLFTPAVDTASCSSSPGLRPTTRTSLSASLPACLSRSRSTPPTPCIGPVLSPEHATPSLFRLACLSHSLLFLLRFLLVFVRLFCLPPPPPPSFRSPLPPWLLQLFIDQEAVLSVGKSPPPTGPWPRSTGGGGSIFPCAEEQHTAGGRGRRPASLSVRETLPSAKSSVSPLSENAADPGAVIRAPS